MSRRVATPVTTRAVHPVDERHQVLSLEGGGGAYMRRPCADCPWRKDAVGVFPAEAFRVSASTAYDMADATFGCHSAGRETPATCAGFLLRGGEHSLRVRLGLMTGTLDLDRVSDGGLDLHDDYVEMAVANGVDRDDPVLRPCRRSSFALRAGATEKWR